MIQILVVTGLSLSGICNCSLGIVSQFIVIDNKALGEVTLYVTYRFNSNISILSVLSKLSPFRLQLSLEITFSHTYMQTCYRHVSISRVCRFVCLYVDLLHVGFFCVCKLIMCIQACERLWRDHRRNCVQGEAKTNKQGIVFPMILHMGTCRLVSFSTSDFGIIYTQLSIYSRCPYKVNLVSKFHIT